MERGNIGRLTKKEERREMKFVDREILIAWLLEVQIREHKEMLSTIRDAIGTDEYNEGV